MSISTSSIPVHEIKSLTGFVRLVESKCNNENILFRGQRTDWELLPKIARLKLKSGLTPHDVEIKMVHKFKRLSKPFLTREPKNEWEWLALAQHHGMATRLLDWSTNPLSALWFATRKPSKESHGVVWIFESPAADILTNENISSSDPYKEKRTKIFQPEIVSARIQSQGGWFTVHKYMVDKRKFIPFEKNTHYKSHLTKIKIPSDNFPEIRYHLDRMGVNQLSQFPDLDGTAQYSEWLYSLLEDEKY